MTLKELAKEKAQLASQWIGKEPKSTTETIERVLIEFAAKALDQVKETCLRTPSPCGDCRRCYATRRAYNVKNTLERT